MPLKMDACLITTKRERQPVRGSPASRAGDITDASLKENLAQFQKEVKRFKESNNIRYQLRSAAEVEREARELKKERNALAKQNEALKQRVQELKGEMRISKEPSVVLRDVKSWGRISSASTAAM